MKKEPIKPTTNQPLTEKAVDLIKQGILLGEFKPTEKLNIEHLKTRYQMGATPIREALYQLTGTGLVEMLPLRGFRVAPYSQEEMADIYRVRELIECRALELSIELGDDQWESEILASYHRLEKLETMHDPREKTNLILWLKRCQDFHLSLLKACQSPWLLKIQAILFEQSERYRYLKVVSAEVSQKTIYDTLDIHKEIVDAVLARNKEKATANLRLLFNNTVKVVSEYLQKSNVSHKPTGKRRKSKP